MTTNNRGAVAGAAYALGGLLWFVVGVVGASIWDLEPQAGSAGFYLSEIVFLVAQLLLCFGLFGLRWSGAFARGLFSTIAFGIAALGHVAFVAAELHSLILGSLSDLLAIAALLSSIGLVLTGIAVLQARRWQGWARWIPLVTGLYFWVAMFPFILVADGPNGYVIAGWGLVRCLLGLAMRAQAAAPAGTTEVLGGLPRRSV
jgi:hypothetical protein